MRLKRLNNLPFNAVKPNFVAFYVFLFLTAASFIEIISSSWRNGKPSCFGCSEINSTWLITSKLANQRARKVLFACVIYIIDNTLDAER